MMRLLIALHATLPAALVAAVLLHVWPPAGLPPLADRPAWAMWALIGLWLSFSAVVLPLRGARLWRVPLAATGALLAVACVSGIVLGTTSAIAMGISLALLSMVCAALAASIGPARVQAHLRVETRPKQTNPKHAPPNEPHPTTTVPNGLPATAAHPDVPPGNAMAHTRAGRMVCAWRLLFVALLGELPPGGSRLDEPPAGAPARTRAAHIARVWRSWFAAQGRHAPFWLAGALAVESFRLAHIVATGAARPSGMVGLLLACLIALPAATLNNWLPRISAALWLFAALGYAGLAVKAGLLQWTLASTLCTVAAGAVLWVCRRQQARRLGTSI